MKGLVGSSGEELREGKAFKEESKSKLTPIKPNNQAEESKSKLVPRKPNNQADSNVNFRNEKEPYIHKDGGPVALSNNSDEYMMQLDEKVKSMIEKSEKKMPVGK